MREFLALLKTVFWYLNIKHFQITHSNNIFMDISQNLRSNSRCMVIGLQSGDLFLTNT